MLAWSPGTHFPDRDATAFMVAALLGGSVRVVMESEAAGEGLERLRRELPRACHACLLVANQAEATLKTRRQVPK